MKNIRQLTLMFIVICIFVLPLIRAEWYNTDYKVKHNLSITAPAGSIVVFNYPNTCQKDAMVLTANNLIYPYEFGLYNQSVIEFIHNSSTNTYKLYCNKTTPTYTNTTIFVLKDDFNNGTALDLSKWKKIQTGGSGAYIKDGWLYGSGTGSGQYWSGILNSTNTISRRTPGGVYLSWQLNTTFNSLDFFGIATSSYLGSANQARQAYYRLNGDPNFAVEIDNYTSTPFDGHYYFSTDEGKNLGNCRRSIKGIHINGTDHNNNGLNFYTNDTCGAANGVYAITKTTSSLYTGVAFPLDYAKMDNFVISFAWELVTPSTAFDYVYVSNNTYFNVSLPVRNDSVTVSGTENYAVSNDTVITLNAPANAYTVNDRIEINYTPVFIGGSVVNCSLFANSTTWSPINFTNNPINNSINTFRPSLLEGQYTWAIQCCLAEACDMSDNRTLNVDLTSPDMSIGANNFFSTTNQTIIGKQQVDSVSFNITLTDNLDLYAMEIYVKRNTDGFVAYNYTNESLSGQTVHHYSTVALNATVSGNYTVNLSVWDSHTAKEIPEMDVQVKKDALVFDKKIQITAEGATKASTKKSKDRYSFNFTYAAAFSTKVFYVESDAELVYKSGSGIKAHFVDFKNKKWIDFEGANGVPIVEKIHNKKYKVTFNDPSTQIYINSIGGLNYNSQLYIFYLNILTVNWTYPTTTPSNNPFNNNSITVRLNVTGNYRNFTVFYVYNSTGKSIYNLTVYNAGNNSYIYNGTIYNLTEIYYYVNATAFDNVGGYTKSTEISIYRAFVNNCSMAGATKVINLSIYNENYPPDTLNATAEIYGTYWINGDVINIFNISGKYGLYPYHEICMYAAPNTTVNTDLYYKYVTPNGFTHSYYYINQSLNINNIIMGAAYNSNTTSGFSVLRITTRDITSYNYYPNVYAKLQRFYSGEGVWRTVQMDKSGEYGLLLFDIIESNQEYRMIYLDKDGYLLKTTSQMKLSCTLGVCDLTYLLRPYDLGSGISSTLTYTAFFDNNTNNVTVTWSDPQGTTKSFRVAATIENRNPPLVICDIQKNASDGTIICPLSGYEGNIMISLYSSQSPFRKFVTFVVTLLENPITNYLPGGQKEGMMWTAFIVIISAFMSIWSPVALIIGALIGLVFTTALGIATIISFAVLMGIGVLGIILAFILRG